MAKRTRERSGAVMAGSGAVIGGGGLVAGGIPGVREPKGENIWLIRGKGRGEPLFPPSDSRGLKSRVHPDNIGHNLKTVAPLPRAGIMGFRTSIHDSFIADNESKTHGDAYVQGLRQGKMESEKKIVRGMRIGRRATYPLTVGGAALTVAGVRRMRENRVRKLDHRKGYGFALGSGATLAGAGQLVPKGLDRFSRNYENSAKTHVLAAERLAPHFGGLKVEPRRVNEFGVVTRPERQTMYPVKSNRELADEGAADRIHGGDRVKAMVGRHRGIASQERHFVEVFDNTSRVMRRLRGPGLSLAAVGAAGLTAEPQRKRRVRKGDVIDLSRAKSYPERQAAQRRRAQHEARHQRNQLVVRNYRRKKAIAGPQSKVTRFVLKHPFTTGGLVFGGMMAPSMVMEHFERKADRKVMAQRRMAKCYDGPRRVAPSAVGKRLVDEETHISVPRALATGAGMGAIAWGGSRGRILGRGLRLGATHPDIEEGLRRVFTAAEVARRTTERATDPLGRAVGRGFGHFPAPVKQRLDEVPRSLRPAASALVGAVMVHEARPVRQTSYSPVVIR